MPNTILDVDDSLLQNNLHFVNKQEDELSELFKAFEKPKTPFVLVRPMPGVCVKMRTETGDKGFINICHTDEIPAPDDISDEKLVSVATSDEPSFVIPMSIGQERLDPDKGGALCPAYDIAINTIFFNKCRDNQIFMVFTIQVMVEAINSKFNKTFDSENCLILKNRKVMGTLQQHRIEKREVRKPQFPKKLIEEVESSSIRTKKTKPIIISNGKNATLTESDDRFGNQKKSKSLDYVILQIPAKGKPKHLIGLFKVPTLVCENLTVDVGEDRIIVESMDANYLVDAFIPYSLDKDKVNAEMDSNLGILRLNLPVKC